jgi:hypothetical protein
VQQVPTLPAGVLPLQKIFAKSQLDNMVAEAWLQSELGVLHTHEGAVVVPRLC